MTAGMTAGTTAGVGAEVAADAEAAGGDEGDEGVSDIATFRMALVHELRAPLQVLQGQIDAMWDDATHLAGAHAPRRRLGTMRSMLDVLAGAVDDVLQLGQGEIAQLPLREAAFEARACLDAEVDAFADAARAKGLDLTCEIADDVPVFLWGDANRLRQIVRILIDNALKYTACGGVAIRVSWAPATGRADDAGTPGAARRRNTEACRLTIQVMDTGPGIPAGMENAVFAAYARADGTRATPGTGLGLWIARQWAGRLGGVLCAQPCTSGARFHLSVPLARAAGAHAGIAAGPSAEGAGRGTALPRATRRDVPVEVPLEVPVAQVAVREGLQALVVDDHVMNRTVLGDQLAALGCHVASAEDLTEALVQWIARDVDVVLTDVHLDGVSGLTLSKTLHALAPMLGRREPVVFAVTGSVVEARAAREAGIDEVLTKPVSRQRLAQILALRWPEVQSLDGARVGDVDAGLSCDAVGQPRKRLPAMRDDPHARRMMRDEMAKDLARFRRLMARRRADDIDAAQLLLHRMRGACRMFGDPALTARCERLAQRLEDCGREPRVRGRSA
ncbi:hypothetical protein AB870_00645 [Pandoraea faecigallinarum]|nr:hypothetical protein AB870_00645 [Pandoraea faecigallinarum]